MSQAVQTEPAALFEVLRMVAEQLECPFSTDEEIAHCNQLRENAMKALIEHGYIHEGDYLMDPKTGETYLLNQYGYAEGFNGQGKAPQEVSKQLTLQEVPVTPGMIPKKNPDGTYSHIIGKEEPEGGYAPQPLYDELCEYAKSKGISRQQVFTFWGPIGVETRRDFPRDKNGIEHPEHGRETCKRVRAKIDELVDAKLVDVPDGWLPEELEQIKTELGASELPGADGGMTEEEAIRIVQWCQQLDLKEAAIENEKTLYQTQADRRLAPIRSAQKYIEAFLEPRLKAWTEQQVKGKKERYVDLPVGRIGLRKSPWRFLIKSRETLEAYFAKLGADSKAVLGVTVETKTAYKYEATALDKFCKEQKKPLPGMEEQKAFDKFYID